MKRIALSALSILAIVAPACGRSGEETPSASIAAPLVVEASEKTRSELGVTAWGIDSGDGGATVVRGYDATQASIIQLEFRTSEGFRYTFDANLKMKGGSAANLKVDLGPSASEARTVENSFATHPEATRVLAQVTSDLDKQPARFAGSANQELLGFGRRPRSGLLSDASVCLTKTCGVSLRGAASAGASATSSCTSSSSECDAAKVPAAQQQADNDCKCGAADSPSGFLAPFPCGETWTYSHHSQEVRQALDFVNPSGTTDGSAVLASADGVATRNSEPAGAGNYISIEHADGWKTYYFHLQSFSVESGATVKQGQEIGRVGSTGASSGPHLHYEQLRGGEGQTITLEGRSLSPYPSSYGEASVKSSNCGK